ncbi:MAG: XdhC family protein [Anaerolineales bacterium]|nr:XdhC family protein [Anaerolineales bacterium]
MQDILPDLLTWLQNDETIALATVVQTWGSSPRGVGAKMGLTASGKMTGSVSGGCVEGAVLEVGQQVLATGQPQLLHFGVADETAWEVGLACGGTVDIFVQPLDLELFQQLRAVYENHQTATNVTIIRGPADILGDGLVWVEETPSPGVLHDELLDTVFEAARFALTEGKSERLILPGGKVEVFAEVIAPPATLVIVGGVHTSIVLAQFAKTLGYRTVIVDPRRAFGHPDRFPHADRLIQAWPDEALQALALSPTTAVAVLTHDPKLDDPALLVALPSRAFYVGALGSQKTQAARRTRLLEAGLTEAQVKRLHGPIGLNLGAKTPEEIALSIIGEVVAVRNLPNVKPGR